MINNLKAGQKTITLNIVQSARSIRRNLMAATTSRAKSVDMNGAGFVLEDIKVSAVQVVITREKLLRVLEDYTVGLQIRRYTVNAC